MKYTEFFFDIDGTLKGLVANQEGFNPEVVGILQRLASVGLVGACTDQSPRELSRFQSKMMKSGGLSQPVFNGLSVLEGGHVIVPRGGDIMTDYQVQTSILALEQLASIKTVCMGILGSCGQWARIPKVPTLVQMPDDASGSAGVGSLSIWEKGPNVHDPTYHGEYEVVMAWFAGVLAALNLTELGLMEAGNGTLRVIQKDINKAYTLAKLNAEGLIHLGASAYFGDGLNDVEAMQLVNNSGGLTIAVANAHPDVKAIAKVVTSRQASEGVMEAYENLLE